MSIVLNVKDENLIKIIKILSKKLNLNLDENGITVLVNKWDKSELDIYADKNQISINYKELSHLSRAIGLVCEQYKNQNNEFHIVEQVQFNTNGLMYDCSRNAVLNVKTVKKILEIMALMGHNVMMLYTEDVYKIDNESYFGYLRGKYTKDEIKELDSYAKILGVELIPCIQTLAHLNQFLRWDDSNKYLDNGDVLLVETENTYNLIDSMIRNISECFSSDKIHIGMDEAFGLGKGNYLKQNGYVPLSKLMVKHLGKVLEIVEKYGKKPMMWDDMFFGHKQDDEQLPPKPENLKLVYWDYYQSKQDIYEKKLDDRMIYDKDLIFAGGAWRWVGFAPHHSITIQNTNTSLNACKVKDVKEVLVTTWGDNGAECPAYSVLLGLQLFAEHGFDKNLDMEKFKQRLEFCTGLSYDDYIIQEKLDIYPLFKDENVAANPSKYLLYQDPMLGLFDKHFEDIQLNLTDYYTDLAKKYEVIKCKNNLYYNSFDYLEKLAKVLAIKWNLGLNISKAYKNNDKKALSRIIENQINPLFDLVENFRISAYNEWIDVNKEFGFEILDIRMGGIISRLKTTKSKLNDFIQGKINNIEILDEEKICFTPWKDEKTGNIIHCNDYEKIISPSRM